MHDTFVHVIRLVLMLTRSALLHKGCGHVVDKAGCFIHVLIQLVNLLELLHSQSLRSPCGAQ